LWFAVRAGRGREDAGAASVDACLAHRTGDGSSAPVRSGIDNGVTSGSHGNRGAVPHAAAVFVPGAYVYERPIRHAGPVAHADARAHGGADRKPYGP
jgi:hypothetical protein